MADQIPTIARSTRWGIAMYMHSEQGAQDQLAARILFLMFDREIHFALLDAVIVMQAGCLFKRIFLFSAGGVEGRAGLFGERIRASAHDTGIPVRTHCLGPACRLL